MLIAQNVALWLTNNNIVAVTGYRSAQGCKP